MSVSNATNENEWETSARKEDLVQTPHGKLHLLVEGPPRKPGQPAVLIVPGLASKFDTWIAVVNHLGPDVRTIRWDRAGLGRSEHSDHDYTAEFIAMQLEEVLSATSIAPPFVLVAQSYGGVISREFLARSPRDAIAGLVLVDTTQEDSFTRCQTPQNLERFLAEVNYREAIGYSTIGRLTDEEASIMEKDEQNQETFMKERAVIMESCRVLGEKKQFDAQVLSPNPVTVIKGDTGRDFRRISEWMKAKEAGSAEDRMEIEALTGRIEQFQEGLLREQLQLSNSPLNRFVVPKDSGHNVQYWEPKLIAEEIRLMLKNIGALE